MVHAFYPCIWKGGAGESLRLNPAWSTNPVSEEPSLGSERNHEKQKAGEDVINRRAIFQPQQAAKLGSFDYVVLTLELRIE